MVARGFFGDDRRAAMALRAGPSELLRRAARRLWAVARPVRLGSARAIWKERVRRRAADTDLRRLR